jgi:lysophospholipid acyltransferase (LPLAT)-like uncharacterized protein
MKIRQPWLIKLLGLLASWLMQCWLSTLHYRLIQLDKDQHPADARRKRFLYALWHDCMLFPLRFRARIHVLISHHADGEFIAQVCRHLNVKAVRGSSRRGGTKALLELMNLAAHSHLLVTPDGPRGPRRQVQLGLIFLASHTGLPIVPVGVGYQKAWRFGSWDRFALPWPYSRAVGVVGKAILVPPQLKRAELEQYRDLVEARLAALTETAERLASGARGTMEIPDEMPRRLAG